MIRVFFLLTIIIPLFTRISAAQSLYVDQWTYIQVDDNKAKWGDFAEPQWLRYFGVDMGNLDGDRDKDILTGRFVYLNPGGDMSGPWDKIDVGINVDGILVIDVDGDENPCVVIVPAGIPSAIQNTGEKPFVIMNMPHPAWHPENQDDHPVEFEDYDWKS